MMIPFGRTRSYYINILKECQITWLITINRIDNKLIRKIRKTEQLLNNNLTS